MSIWPRLSRKWASISFGGWGQAVVSGGQQACPELICSQLVEGESSQRL